MNLESLLKFSAKTEGISGWLSFHDVAVFNVLLSSQSNLDNSGNLLEIGVFAGKSAVLVGQYLREGEEFHTCDIFDEPTDVKNMEEIERSYPELSRSVFEANCVKVLGFIPVIHQCPSSDLPKILEGKTFRFIHIDGSHLYNHVIGDLKFSSKTLLANFGVISVDDFRAQHTVGVALAVWELVLKGEFIPLILTPAKIYLGKPGSKIDIDEIKTSLEALGINSVFEEILGHKALRTIGLSDADLYSKKIGLIAFVPPVVLVFLRESYFWKKLRNR